MRFDLTNNSEVFADGGGVHRCIQFPGLWIDERALFAENYAAAIATLQAGLIAPAHEAFVSRLAAAKKP
jgi:hypothetical protein